MENLKIRVNSEAESKEAQELVSELGYKKYNWSNLENYPIQINAASKNMTYSDFRNREDLNGIKKVTLGELRALVSLHKNPINMDKVLSGVRSDALGLLEDKSVKEWLNTKTYEYKKAVDMGGHNKWVEIPEGATQLTKLTKLTKLNNILIFWKDGFNLIVGVDKEWDKHCVTIGSYMDINRNASLVWQRPTQPKELPFVDDDPNQTTINAMNEADALFSDAVNHPSHYASGEIECIDAIESSMTHEAFCGYLKGNVQKYMWRYENKGGLESLEKAQWYLNKLISRIS